MAKRTLELKDLSAGQQYALQVRAVGDGQDVQNSNWSLTLNFTTDEDTVAPNAPSNLDVVVDGSSFVGTWNPPTTNEDSTSVEDFKDYKVVVTDVVGSNSVTYYTTNSRFEFTEEMNLAAFGSSVSGVKDIPDFLAGQIKFDVYSRDLANNESSSPATDTATNSAPCSIDLVDETDGQPLTAQVNWTTPPNSRPQHMYANETGYATVPDEAALDITGDLDLRAEISMDNIDFGSYDSYLIDKRDTGSDSGYALKIDDYFGWPAIALEWGDGSNMNLYYYTLGSEPDIDDDEDNKIIQIRATADFNGTNVTWTVYRRNKSEGVALDTDTGWNQIGTETVSYTPTGPTANGTDLRLGNEIPSGTDTGEVSLYRAIVMDNIGGTPVLDVQFSDTTNFTVGSLTGTADTGQTVTLTAPAEIRKTVSCGGDILAYRLLRSTISGDYTNSVNTVTYDTSFVNGGLSRGTYYFKVEVYDKFGNITTSNEVESEVKGFWESEQAVPDTPTISNVATAFDTGTQTSDLTFDVTGPSTADGGATTPYDFHSHYEIRWSTSASGPFQYQTIEEEDNGATHSVAINGLKPNTLYYYGAKSVSQYGRSGAYETGSLTTDVDSTPPAAPANPSATGSLKNITAQWDANTESDLNHYLLYADQSSGFTPGAGNKVYQGNGTGFAHSVGDGETWYFIVRAVDNSGNVSADSVEFSGTSSGNISVEDTTPPSQVTGVSVSATTYYHGSSERAYADVSWSAATDDVGVTGYVVSYSVDAQTTWTETVVSGDQLGHRVVDLEPGVEVATRVKAVDAAGNLSTSWSTVSTDTPTSSSTTTIDAPTLVSVVSTAPGTLDINWNSVTNVPVSNYVVQVDDNGSGFPSPVQFDSGSTFLTLSGVNGSTYHVRVAAVDEFGGQGPWSTTLNATVESVDTDNLGTIDLGDSAFVGQLAADRIIVGSATTFDSGYDPSTKETPSGAQTKADAAEAAAITAANGYTDGEVDGLITTYYQATEPGSGNTGDLWIDTDTDRLYRYDGASWTEIQDADIAQAIADAGTAQATADGKIESFYQTTAPTAGAVGDLWFDTDDNNHPYRWNGSTWTDARDGTISDAQADANQALADAADAQATADGKVTTFYQSTAPTAEGVGDMWIDTDTDRLYRWDGAAWQEVQDADISQALSDAATAQSTADSKIVTFYQTAPPTAQTVGDLWVDTDNGDRLHRWNGSAWVDVHDGAIDTALADAQQAISDAADAQATADGKVTTFYQASQPTADGTGDLWIDTDTDRLYRWSGSAWVEIQDADIAQAISDAATAQSTADSKIVTFYQTTAPTAEGVGDLWVDTDDENKLYRWNGTSWVSIRDGYIDTAANAAQSAAEATAASYSDTIEDAIRGDFTGTATGTLIDGAFIQTGTIEADLLVSDIAIVNGLRVQSLFEINTGGFIRSDNWVAGTSGFSLDSNSLEIYGDGTLENVSVILGGSTGLNLNTTTDQLWFGAAAFADAAWRIDGAGNMRVGSDNTDPELNFYADSAGNIWSGNNLMADAPWEITNDGAARFDNVQITADSATDGTNILTIGTDFILSRQTGNTAQLDFAGTMNITGDLNVNNGSVTTTGGNVVVGSTGTDTGVIKSNNYNGSAAFTYDATAGFALDAAGVLNAVDVVLSGELNVADDSTFSGNIYVSTGTLSDHATNPDDGDWSIKGDGSARFDNLTINGGSFIMGTGAGPGGGSFEVSSGILYAEGADINGDIKADSGYLQNLTISGLLTATGSTGRVEIDTAGVRLYDAISGGNLKVDLNTTTGNASFDGDITAQSGTIEGELTVNSRLIIPAGASDIVLGDDPLSDAAGNAGIVIDKDSGAGTDGYNNSWLQRSDGSIYFRTGDATDYIKMDTNAASTLIVKGEVNADSGTLGNITVSSGGEVESSNYSAGSAGWQINGAGSAEFNDATIRGDLIVTHTSSGEDFTTTISDGKDIQFDKDGTVLGFVQGMDEGGSERGVRIIYSTAVQDPRVSIQNESHIEVKDNNTIRIGSGVVGTIPTATSGYISLTDTEMQMKAGNSSAPVLIMNSTEVLIQGNLALEDNGYIENETSTMAVKFNRSGTADTLLIESNDFIHLRSNTGTRWLDLEGGIAYFGPDSGDFKISFSGTINNSFRWDEGSTQFRWFLNGNSEMALGTSGFVCDNIYSSDTVYGTYRTVYANSDGGIGTTGSSLRYKRNIDYLSPDDTSILSISPAKFDKRFGTRRNGIENMQWADQRFMGFIAEEIAAVEPDAAIYEDGEVVDYDDRALTALLFNELKRLSLRVEELEGMLGNERSNK